MLRRLGPMVLVAGALGGALGGCSRSEDYATVIRDQVAALEEVNRLLAGVTDAASMETAKEALAAQYAKSEANAKRGRSLPKPGPEERQRLAEEAAQMQRVAQKYLEEVQRVKTLPRGADFLAEVGILKRAEP